MRAKRLGQMKPLVNDQPFERQKRKDHGPWLEYLHGLEYLQQTGEAKPQTVVKYPQCLQHTRQIAKMQDPWGDRMGQLPKECGLNQRSHIWTYQEERMQP